MVSTEDGHGTVVRYCVVVCWTWEKVDGLSADYVVVVCGLLGRLSAS